jgi:AcrR family transcriptional regulator
MARPVTICDEELLRAAREVFLSRGIKGTTAEIAERAGVSEGSLFRRYRSKLELLQAALSAENTRSPWDEALLHGPPSEDVAATLQTVCLQSVEFYRRMMPLWAMAWSNPGPDGGLPAMLSEPSPPPLRSVKLLSGYLEAQMRKGRLRRHDPEVVARTLLGSLVHLPMFELFMRSSDVLPMPAETFVRGLLRMLFVGLTPEGAPGGTKRKRSARGAARPVRKRKR